MGFSFKKEAICQWLLMVGILVATIAMGIIGVLFFVALIQLNSPADLGDAGATKPFLSL